MDGRPRHIKTMRDYLGAIGSQMEFFSGDSIEQDLMRKLLEDKLVLLAAELLREGRNKGKNPE